MLRTALATPAGLAVAFTLVVLTGCATEPLQEAAVPAGDEQICSKVVPVGTTIAQRRCRTRAQIERERAAGSDTADSIRSNRVTPPIGQQ